MRVAIAGWSSEGLRCPDVEIDLRTGTGAPHHVSFLQMPNGTGKTTTLDLIKAALSGEAERWDEAAVRSLRRRDDDNSRGSFRVKLLVDGKPLTFEIDLDFESGRALCLTTRPGSGGVTRSWNPPTEVRRFLDASFLNLFVFNGELANEMFEKSRTRAEDAIDALCQLYLVEDVAEHVEAAWTRTAKERAGPKTEATLAALRDRREGLLARKAKLQRLRTKAVDEMAAAKARSQELEEKIRASTAADAADRDALAAAEKEETRTDAVVAAATTAAHQTMRLPLSLSTSIGTALVAWKDSLEDLKLPEATSAQFFTDLLKQVECICGNPMSDVMRDEIRIRSKQVLSSAENGELNAIKRDIERYQPSAGAVAPHEELQIRLAALSAARRAQLKAQQDARALRRRLIDAGGEQVRAWEEEQAGHDARHLENESILKSIDDPGLNSSGGEETFSLARIDREIEDATTKITDATDTVELRAKTATVQAILNRAGDIARRRIKRELLDVCNGRLASILTNDPIELESIDGHLKLRGQERGSEAQMLSVGYTFLMTLLERGDNRFPLLVDSPVGKMDGTVRRHVGRLIPELCSQFITFVINTERADFVPAVESRAREAQRLTFFRKTDGTRRLMRDLPAGHCTETATGVLVEDARYFETFDMQEEDG